MKFMILKNMINVPVEEVSKIYFVKMIAHRSEDIYVWVNRQSFEYV